MRTKLHAVSFLFILFFLITIIVNSVYAHINNQEFFLQANALYHEKNYQKALNQYQKIERKGWAVLYNMGNCYYMLNDYVNALVHWKRALSHGAIKAFDAIHSNCNGAEQKLGLKPDNESMLSLLNLLSSKIPLIVWQILFLLLLYGTIFSVRWLWINRFYSILTLLILLLLSSGLLLIQQWQRQTVQRGIILENVNLCSGTDIEFKKNDKVMPGQEVMIIDERQDWVHIYTHNNMLAGWIKKIYIELI